jgi:hypothetical protein
MQPGTEVLGIDDGTETHADAVFLFDLACEGLATIRNC